MQALIKLLATPQSLVIGTLILLTGVYPGQAQTSPATSWTPVGETSTPGPDYSQPQYWMIAPENPGAQPVDVLFMHTTTYKDPNYVDPTTKATLTVPIDPSLPLVWNQTIADAILDSAGTALTYTQVSVFGASCNIYAPFYRQAALPEALMGDTAASERTLSVAYADIEAAFDYYMTYLNHGRPFILAGHSQGANLTLWLLQRRMSNPSYLRNMVAAYVIGWSVTQNELNRYSHLKVCTSATQTGCIVTYNTQGPLAQVSMARPGAISVNPLLWNISTDVAPREMNMGTVLIPPVGNAEMPQYTGAYNLNGALILTDPPQDPPMVNASEVYHIFDYALFYRNLEQNVKDRISAFASR